LATLSGNHYFGVGFGSIVFALPSVQQALAKLAASGAVAREHMNCSIALTQRPKGLGFPYGFGCTVSVPYDLVTDFMRGAKGIMTDLYRHRDKLAAVFEKIKKLSVGPAIAAAKKSGNPLVFIPIHWAADSFISQKHFEEVWWLSAREMLVELIDSDLIPLVLWESDCTKRLETIKDIPAGRCIYWFERTDMVKAFEVLGDMVALRGNVSASTLVTGMPADVDAEVKRLVDKVWNKGGKLILDAAFGVPDESPVENVRAMYSQYAGTRVRGPSAL
jgi:uroporphyrinogen-III decarboxylase